jgi:hypothetical protein
MPARLLRGLGGEFLKRILTRLFDRNRKGDKKMIPRDAVDLEDFKRMERGLPPRPKPKVVKPEPEPPVVPDRIRFENIPDKEIRDFAARRHSVRNSSGTIFCGYNFYLEFTDNKSISGWIDEGTLEQLKKRIPQERIDLLRKIG